MNKQGEGKIEWCDLTWSPMSGCKRGCSYCYASKIYRRFGRSFDPQFHPERLRQPMKIKKPSKIFVCSAADLFGDWVPSQWITDVFEVMAYCKWHTFIVLTSRQKITHACSTIELTGIWAAGIICRTYGSEQRRQTRRHGTRP